MDKVTIKATKSDSVHLKIELSRKSYITVNNTEEVLLPDPKNSNKGDEYQIRNKNTDDRKIKVRGIYRGKRVLYPNEIVNYIFTGKYWIVKKDINYKQVHKVIYGASPSKGRT